MHIPKRHLQIKKMIFDSSKQIQSPCLWVPLKLSEKNLMYHFTCISFIKSSHLWNIDIALEQLQHYYISIDFPGSFKLVLKCSFLS